MITTLSLAVVTIIGFIILAFSLWGIVWPAKLIRVVQLVMEHRSGIWVAVFVRLVLGAALIVSGPVSGYPKTFMVLGWIAVLAALGLALIGRNGMRRVVGMFSRFSPLFIRAWLLLGIAFGLFLVIGALSSSASAMTARNLSTWSLAAMDPATGDVGVAFASCVSDMHADGLAALVPGVGVAERQYGVVTLTNGEFRCNRDGIRSTAATAGILVARAGDPPYAAAAIGLTDQGSEAAPWLAISEQGPLEGPNPIIEVRRRYAEWSDVTY